MAKDEGKVFETPNYEAISSLDECDVLIEKHKNNLVGKDRLQYQIKEGKKEFVKAANEQLKEIQEEREHEMGVLSALEQHKMLLANGGPSAMPMPPMILRAVT
jgi:hypothetical protein